MYNISSRLSCGLSRRSAASRLLGSPVRIPLRAWIFVYCVCCVGSGLCDVLIPRSEESYRLYVCVCVCDLGTSTNGTARPELVCCVTENDKQICGFKYCTMAQGVYRRRCTSEAKIRSLASRHLVRDARSETNEILVFPCHCHSTNILYPSSSSGQTGKT